MRALPLVGGVRTIEPSVCEQTLLAPLFLFSVRLTVNYNFCAHEPYMQDPMQDPRVPPGPADSATPAMPACGCAACTTHVPRRETATGGK